MNQFDVAFSEASILRWLCAKRAGLARKRHEREFFVRLHGPIKLVREEEELVRAFPSRKMWIRPRQSERSKIRSDLNSRVLLNTVLSYRARRTEEAWSRTLFALVDDIRSRAMSLGGQYFDPPRIVAMAKPGKPDVYRPLAMFGLKDSAVLALASSYMRKCVDPDLLPCALAFRVKVGESAAPTHHDAVERILRFNESVQRSAKWVSECDISAFYDSVSHLVAQQAMERAVERAARRGVEMDIRALRIFSAYLGCYAFSQNVMGRAVADLKEINGAGVFKWDETALKRFYSDPMCERIGIPQGGALSNVIANLVLDHADRAVMGARVDPNLLYLRYCDDMVVIHTRKRACEAAHARYLGALEELKLPAHAAQSVEIYGSKFWEYKSKKPFRWSAREGDVPWVAFVGYHVHYRNWLRLRPSSLAKELGKQAELAARIIRSIPRIGARGIGAHQVMHRLRQRLIAMSVGRRRIDSDLSAQESFCWASGFRLFNTRPHSGKQLKILDRAREKQIARVKRAFASTKIKSTAGVMKLKKLPRFYGGPFSYFGQFRHTASRMFVTRRS